MLVLSSCRSFIFSLSLRVDDGPLFSCPVFVCPFSYFVAVVEELCASGFCLQILTFPEEAPNKNIIAVHFHARLKVSTVMVDFNTALFPIHFCLPNKCLHQSVWFQIISLCLLTFVNKLIYIQHHADNFPNYKFECTINCDQKYFTQKITSEISKQLVNN